MLDIQIFIQYIGFAVYDYKRIQKLKCNKRAILEPLLGPLFRLMTTYFRRIVGKIR